MVIVDMESHVTANQSSMQHMALTEGHSKTKVRATHENTVCFQSFL